MYRQQTSLYTPHSGSQIHNQNVLLHTTVAIQGVINWTQLKLLLPRQNTGSQEWRRQLCTDIQRANLTAGNKDAY